MQCGEPLAVAGITTDANERLAPFRAAGARQGHSLKGQGKQAIPPWSWNGPSERPRVRMEWTEGKQGLPQQSIFSRGWKAWRVGSEFGVSARGCEAVHAHSSCQNRKRCQKRHAYWHQYGQGEALGDSDAMARVRCFQSAACAPSRGNHAARKRRMRSSTSLR